jgi:hypothetical protein
MGVVLAVLLAGLVLGGCARKRASASDDDMPPLPTTLLVENRRSTDYTLYVDRGGARQRLGMVSGPGSARFTIPADLVSFSTPLRVTADPLAGRELLHESAVVRRGDTLILYINPTDAQLVLTPSP